MLKSEGEAWELFDILSENSLQHAQYARNPSPGPKKGGIHEVSFTSTIELTCKVDNLCRQMTQMMSQVLPIPQVPPQEDVCANCYNYGHHESGCPHYEEINAIQSGNSPYGDTFNLRWKDHPNQAHRVDKIQTLGPHSIMHLLGNHTSIMRPKGNNIIHPIKPNLMSLTKIIKINPGVRSHHI